MSGSKFVRVSFVIPLYNNLPLTQAMLASLQATLPRDLTHEIIFIDDGSTDGTRAWLPALAGRDPFRVLLNERNLGYAAANNRAAASARGEFLCLLNNDLLLTPRWLEPMLSAHAAEAKIGIVGNVQRAVATGQIDHAGVWINAKIKPVHDRSLPPFAPALKSAAAVTGACCLIQRALWEGLGGFDTGFMNGGEDVDLCLRVRERGLKVVVAQRSIVGHHVSASFGRKQRDEYNSRRLAQRWRRTLIALAQRAWCRDYCERELNAATAFTAPWEGLQIALHAAGLTRRAPIAALREIAGAFDRELERWDTLLGPEPATTRLGRRE